jgi:hypothetical protein
MEKNNFFITYSGVVEFNGKIQDKTSKAGKPYQMRDFAVTLNDTRPEYPVTLVFSLIGPKKLPLVEGLTKGEEVVITFTINSRSYTTAEGETKYFPSFNLFKVDRGGMNQANNAISFDQAGDDDSGLPF